MDRERKKLFTLLSIGILAIMAISYVGYNKYVPKPERISYNQFIEYIEDDQVERVILNEDALMHGVLKDETKFVTDNPMREGFREELLKRDITVDEKNGVVDSQQVGGFILMMAILGSVLVVVSRNSSKQLNGGAGKLSSMQITPEEVSVKFDDVAGNEEAKESVRELIDFINNPDKYSKYGARLPRGIIFYGPPGTGKTLMAKALAGEAGVPFYAVSGSDFVQVYVGVGAGRIRDLFKKARANGKCVIFIDEIDALGKKRDGGIDGGGNDERDQTLNALLAEMSGFNDNEGIVVIAATNRLDTLDEALLRPGRFDRHVEIGLPDINGRFQILKLHSRNKPVANTVDLKQVARQTVYFSGAKLENMMNEAAIMAAKRDSGSIEYQDIDRAFYTVIAGAEKKDRSNISDVDRKITAYHEAGHALITKLVAPENRVSKITIVPSTKGAGGFSMNIPPDRMYMKKTDMENMVRIALAGRCAEEIIFGADNITSGASNDLERATEVMMNMVRRFGMSNGSGLLNYDVLYQNGIRHVGQEMIEECKTNLESLYIEVRDLLNKQINLLQNIAETLLEKETLNEKELDSLINPC